jgi:hypothetical protein
MPPPLRRGRNNATSATSISETNGSDVEQETILSKWGIPGGASKNTRAQRARATKGSARPQPDISEPEQAEEEPSEDELQVEVSGPANPVGYTMLSDDSEERAVEAVLDSIVRARKPELYKIKYVDGEEDKVSYPGEFMRAFFLITKRFCHDLTSWPYGVTTPA